MAKVSTSSTFVFLLICFHNKVNGLKLGESVHVRDSRLSGYQKNEHRNQIKFSPGYILSNGGFNEDTRTVEKLDQHCDIKYLLTENEVCTGKYMRFS